MFCVAFPAGRLPVLSPTGASRRGAPPRPVAPTELNNNWKGHGCPNAVAAGSHVGGPTHPRRLRGIVCYVYGGVGVGVILGPIMLRIRGVNSLYPSQRIKDKWILIMHASEIM